MRILFGMAAILLAVFGLYRFMHSGAPSPGEVEPLVRSFLEESCNGEVEITQLDSIRVGDYAQQFGGWPVYANHEETCVEHDDSKPYKNTMTTTHDSGHDADRNVAVAFARRTASGHLELYTPELFQSAQRDMQKMLDHAFDNAKVN
jgi:hypothetical protein